MATISEIQQLYIAYFGRPADPAGLDYWVSTGISTKDFAAAMYAQPEFQQVNAGLSVSQQVNALYVNLFGRDADVDGLTYWTQEVNTGKIALASIANDLIFAANNNPSDQSKLDKAALDNKTATALTYTSDVRESSASFLAYNPTSTNPWVTGPQFASANAFLDTATDTNAPNAAAVQASVDAMTAITPPGQTFALTTGIDSFTGTPYGDTFNAALDAGVMTLNSLDSINGNGGIDTLNVQLANIAANTSITARSLANIEDVVITNTSDSDVWTVNLVNAPQVESVAISGSTAGGDTTVSNIAAGGTSLSVADVANNETIFAYAVTSGAADVANLTVNNVTGGADTTITIAGVETLNVTATVAESTVELEAAAANTITFAGDVSNTVTTTGTTGVELFDGRGTTDALNLTLSNQSDASADVSVYGGSGNDSLDVGAQAAQDTYVNGGAGNDTVTTLAASLTSSDTYIGGEGTDTLSINTAVTTTALGARFSEFETLTTTDATTQNMNVFGNTTFTRLNNGDSVTSTFNNASANVATLGLANGSTTTLARATDTSADALTIALSNTAVATAATANNEESITITTSRTTGSSRVTNAVSTLNASDLTGLTISGADNLGSTTLAGSTNLATVTSTDLVGSLNLNAGVSTVNLTANLGNGATTLTSGSGNDVINGGSGNDSLAGGAGNDSITGGNGTDELVAGAGSDTLIGGTGVDTFTFASNLTNGDSVVGGDRTDVLTATLSAGTLTPASISGVETFTISAAGGALNATNVTGLNTLNVSSSAVTSFTNLGSSVTAINQVLNSGSSAVTYGFATGAAATVTYTPNAAAVTTNIANATTTVSNIANLTILGDNNENAGATDGTTLSTGNISAGSALNSLTIKSDLATNGAGVDNTVTTGSITSTGLASLTIAANAADVSVSTAANTTLAGLTGLTLSTTTAGQTVDFVDGQKLVAANLQTLTVNATAGNVTMGNLGTIATDADSSIGLTAINVTAATGADVTLGALYLGTATSGYSSSLDTVSITAGDETLLTLGDIVATGASLSSFTVSIGADVGASSVGAVTASAVGSINITFGDGGGSLTLADFEAASVGNVTVATDDEVTFTDLGASAGTLGDIVVTGAGVVTVTSDAVTSLGGVDTTGSTADNLITLSNSTLIGTTMDAGTGNNNFTGTGGADVITMGEGDDTVRGNAGADSINLGTGSDQVNFTTIATTDSVTNFSTGATGDVSGYVLTSLNAEFGDLVDGDGVSIADADSPDLSSAIAIGGATFTAGDNIFVFSTTTAADTLTAIQASAFAGGLGTPADNDGLLYAYVDASADLHIGIAVVQVTGDLIDTAVMSDLAVLTGTYTTAGLNIANFDFLA